MTRPAWFKPFSRILSICGTLSLLAGVTLYGRRALTGDGSMLLIFGLIMAALGFFNAITVIAKHLDRRDTADRRDNPSPHL